MPVSLQRMIVILFFLAVAGKQCCAQKYLAIDRYRFGKVKREEFYPGHILKYRTVTKEDGLRRDTIRDMNDSSLVFGDGSYIRLRDIKVIYFERIWVRVIRHWTSAAGLGFIGLDAFNNLINNDRPVFKERALMIGGIIFLAGQSFRLIPDRKYRPGKNSMIRVYDLRIR